MKRLLANFYEHGGHMQQWEYRTALLVEVVHVGNYRGWQFKEMNERKLPNWKETEEYSTVADFCNQMGQQGWELVSTSGSLSAARIELYFKRPI